MQSLNHTTKERRIHLLGHSFGGSLAYEYSKKHPEKVQSLILSNAAASMKIANDEYRRLHARNPSSFWHQNVCKIKSPALEDSFQHLGKVWSSMDAVIDYVATPPKQSDAVKPGTLIINCQDDFGYEASKFWREIVGGEKVEEALMQNCAHYPHLEDQVAFGRVLDDFMIKWDEETSE